MAHPSESPILALKKAISGAAFSIAPERAEALKNDPSLTKFSLVVTDDRGFTFRVDTSTHEAFLPIPAMEYVWCCGYLCWQLYQAFIEAQEQERASVNTGEAVALSAAMGLFNWSKVNMYSPTYAGWPEGPCPLAQPEHGTAVHVANELFLASLAWLIHHEIAHVRLGHGRAIKGLTAKQEEECDRQATEWILNACPPDQLQKRQLGMVVALFSMQFLDEPDGAESHVGSHPPSVDRIDYCLTTAAVEDDSLVAAFAATMLLAQTTQLGIEEEATGQSFRDILARLQVAFRTAGR